MVALLLAPAALAISTPIVAAVIVVIASRREDKARTLGLPVHGRVEKLARRILGF